MMPDLQHIEGHLMNNWHWTQGVPYVKGLDYTATKKKWDAIKIVLLRRIKKDLDTCELQNGNSFAMEVWQVIYRELGTAKWTTVKCGPFGLWRSMYRKASLKVQQERPKTLGEAAKAATDDVLAKAMDHAGMNEVFE